MPIGERGQYVLCANEDVMLYIQAMIPMSNAAGLTPEQA